LGRDADPRSRSSLLFLTFDLSHPAANLDGKFFDSRFDIDQELRDLGQTLARDGKRVAYFPSSVWPGIEFRVAAKKVAPSSEGTTSAVGGRPFFPMRRWPLRAAFRPWDIRWLRLRFRASAFGIGAATSGTDEPRPSWPAVITPGVIESDLAGQRQAQLFGFGGFAPFRDVSERLGQCLVGWL
jgi:hypothetical protein